MWSTAVPGSLFVRFTAPANYAVSFYMWYRVMFVFALVLTKQRYSVTVLF